MQKPIITKVNGQNMTFEQIHEKYHTNIFTLRYRFRKGLRGNDLIKPTAKESKPKYLVQGEKLTLDEISNKYHVKLSTLYKRADKGKKGDALIQQSWHPVVTINGQKLTIREVSDKYNIKYDTVKRRYLLGDKGQRLIRPVKKVKKYFDKNYRYDFNGEKLTLKEIGKKYHIQYNTLITRINDNGHKFDSTIIRDKGIRKDGTSYISFKGKQMTLNQIHDLYPQIAVETLRQRYVYSNLRDDDLIKPINKNKIYFFGTVVTFQELKEEYGIPLNTLKNRFFKLGKRDEDLVAPVGSNGRKKTIIYKGKKTTYYDLSVSFKKYKLQEDTIKARYSKGWRDDKLTSVVRPFKNVSKTKTNYLR